MTKYQIIYDGFYWLVTEIFEDNPPLYIYYGNSFEESIRFLFNRTGKHIKLSVE